MILKKHISGCLFALSTLLIIPVSWAKSADATMPYHFKADSIEVNRQLHTTTYIGHVLATQGTTTLRGDSVTLWRNAKSNQIIKLQAIGTPAHYSTLPEHKTKKIYARAKTILYWPLKHMVLLIKQAHIQQENNLFTGSRIRYNITRQTVETDNHVTNSKTKITIQPLSSPS